ncbi:flagellin [Phenylobacterium montanum]|uniref:Flagellin n=1 Tax=Phenylobacterium montanum TaxID=2823693 RepID=A0A975G066_9CAUL|nr:flagellin [Caulobacter sp. S6]QUD88103.1 flagellin [Caulobacter sp. S6]
MTLSVNSNNAALIALENLNATQSQLGQTQSEISTGLKVGSAKDNASVWAIAQGQRADISALDSVQMSLNRATSIADVASTAGASVSDLLSQLKAQVVAAMDPSNNQTSRNLINDDFRSLLSQITNVVNNASFDGANVLNGSLGAAVNFLANTDGTSFITLATQNLSLGGGIISVTANATISTVTAATALLTFVNQSLTAVDSALGQLGSQSSEISAHNTFVGKLQDTLTTGVGNLVDANMAAESAKLQALQVQQQLGAQALSIANQAPQVILSLFK